MRIALADLGLAHLVVIYPGARDVRSAASAGPVGRTRRPAHALQETRAALAEADAGDFASDDEIRAVTTKWNVDAG
ncbi:MAG: hypothetical protein MUE61_22095 [Vicinamibacterales bacterium]|nr:hypothetical protein [Vicinamibacterales bacterium]